MTNEEHEFLSESNKIEGVTDYDSLQQAAFAWEWLKEQPKITITVILKTHKILMLHQAHLKGYERGYFREVPVWVGGREGSDWRQIRTELRDWCSDLKIIPDWKGMHVRYETIHPFVDGNGRTGRMFMNFHRLKLGLPILIIHAGQEQLEYYEWFRTKKRNQDQEDGKKRS